MCSYYELTAVQTLAESPLWSVQQNGTMTALYLPVEPARPDLCTMRERCHDRAHGF